MSHTNLQATLPVLQSLAIEGGVGHEVLGKAAVADGAADLVSGEELLLWLPVEGHAGVVGGAQDWDLERLLAFKLALLHDGIIKPILCPPRRVVSHGLPKLHAHVEPVPPRHLCGLALTVGLRIDLQGVEETVLWWVLPLVLRGGQQNAIDVLLGEHGTGNVLQVGELCHFARFLCHLDLSTRLLSATGCAAGSRGDLLADCHQGCTKGGSETNDVERRCA
mmetsp:Transcript_14365/g.33907  ORF Transcript_14365/g.33907 Transcript_14365/m.33907 type:complete len:221 (+) Transcript_14365:433-1095(+)